MNKPLAFRLRPTTIDDVIGQEHLTKDDGFLKALLTSKQLVSMIFYGKPGTGKTSLANAFASDFGAHPIFINAVNTSKKELEDALTEVKLYNCSIIIIDEVHRLNKEKQDFLLPHLEDGSIYIIGTTTANPLIALSPALRSRSQILEIKPLTIEQVAFGLKRIDLSKDPLFNKTKVTDEVIQEIAKASGGDMRFALNYLEVGLLSSLNKTLTLDKLALLNRVPNVASDKNDDEHYDLVSALQKSIRGSEVDAALYYLGRLALANDLDSIERRLLVTAYEDVGLGNPQAVSRTYEACQVARLVGFPEALIPLSLAVTDLCLSPKSKSACGAGAAAFAKASETILPIRDYLRLTRVNVDPEDSYPYDIPSMWEKMEYLPSELIGTQFYKPVTTGAYERALIQNYERLSKETRSTNLRMLRRRIKS